jgi:tripartite-type tricarboxylate transporter receptor subunit TctC
MIRPALLFLAILAVVPAPATAQVSSYPSKPIRIIVGTSPSGGTDFSARLFGQQLSSRFGQPVVIDNRPGASGLIGMELVARSDPDGYTLLVLSVGHLMAASLAQKPAFDPAKDFAPISQLVSTPMLLAVHPSVPVKTLADLIKLARSTNGKLTFASGGTGGVQHMATALFMHEAKIEMTHVPYKGSGPGIIDLLAGNVQMTMTGVAPLLPFIRAGKLRPLAITGDKRSPVLPEVPTFSESGLPGVAIDGWHGMLAPAKTPEPVIRKLGLAIAEIARMPDIRAKLSAEGAVPIGSTPAEFTKFFLSEQRKWTRLARDMLALKR